MALDGIFLSKIKKEIVSLVIGARVEKITQPAKEEIVLFFRGREGSKKLCICPSANAPRIHFIEKPHEAPQSAPMFCMLLRKHLSGAILTDVVQIETDRVLHLVFSASNEIGDRVSLKLCVEIMGKCSNIILVDENNVIIDAIKRVPISVSTVRQIIPKLKYELPEKQDKLNLLETEVDEIFSAVLSNERTLLSKSVLSSVQGISPVVAREIAFLSTGNDEYIPNLSEVEKELLFDALGRLKKCAENDGELFILYDGKKKPKDISFFPIEQYGPVYTSRAFSSPSALLETFYDERDELNRMNARGKELLRAVNSILERVTRKLANQRADLESCKNAEQWKLYGELITNNIYSLKKGSSKYELQNYYDNMTPVVIEADPALTPTENANRYYRRYRKAKTAEGILKDLIVQKEEEIQYLETVLDEISRAETDNEIELIKQELVSCGYLKNRQSKKKKPPKELPPMRFETDDGYTVLVGRNNVQNERLSLKTAHGNDMWLHTQQLPGSHVIICAKEGEVSDLSIEQAASIAAYFSKARGGSLVPVDYTRVKALKKPNGSKPGKVIYHEYYTIIVKPDKELVERLRA